MTSNASGTSPPKRQRFFKITDLCLTTVTSSRIKYLKSAIVSTSPIWGFADWVITCLFSPDSMQMQYGCPNWYIVKGHRHIIFIYIKRYPATRKYMIYIVLYMLKFGHPGLRSNATYNEQRYNAFLRLYWRCRARALWVAPKIGWSDRVSSSPPGVS